MEESDREGEATSKRRVPELDLTEHSWSFTVPGSPGSLYRTCTSVIPTAGQGAGVLKQQPCPSLVKHGLGGGVGHESLSIFQPARG